jgi:ABC-type amino acid transport substrate-binding protein
MKSKNTIIGICMTVLFLGTSLSSFGQLSGDTFAQAKKTGKAKVTFTYVETPGFAERKGNDLTGICPDIMNAFFAFVKEQYNIDMEATIVHKSKDYPFSDFLLDVSRGNGGVFGLGNITITAERKNFLTFSHPFIDNVTLIMTGNAAPTLNSLNELSTTFAGMYAVTIKNTTNEKQVEALKAKYYPGMKIEYVPNQRDALDRVLSDPKAFTNLDFTYYLTALKERKPIKRHPAGDQSSEQFGFIMPRGSDWAEPLDKFLKSGYVGGVEYRKVISTHLGANALKLLDAVAN